MIKTKKNMKKYLKLMAFAIFAIFGITIVSCGGDDDDNSNGGNNGSDNDNAVNYVVNGVSFKMVKVKGGTFQMGATSEQVSDAQDDEKPAHQVTLSDYYIGETEVTQDLWMAVMGSNPSSFRSTGKLPVESISWDDCQTFITKLRTMTGQYFRLPTESEWEFAARGGTKSKGYKYCGSNDIDAVAWYRSNSEDGTHVVGTKAPNELGLYDMSGNLWEFCQDWYGSYGNTPQTNPAGPATGSDRVIRGGCWHSQPTRQLRVSDRSEFDEHGLNNMIGLRLAL